MKIIGVTKCPTGIAHTYMAAARIEKECERLGYEVKVETQGSQGTENKLTKREIAKADYQEKVDKLCNHSRGCSN